jgi:hypothetical protein
MLFIYKKQNTGEIEVMEAHEALDIDRRHDAKDWELIASVDAKVYIRSLLREYPALVRVFKERWVMDNEFENMAINLVRAFDAFSEAETDHPAPKMVRSHASAAEDKKANPISASDL